MDVYTNNIHTKQMLIISRLTYIHIYPYIYIIYIYIFTPGVAINLSTFFTFSSNHLPAPISQPWHDLDESASPPNGWNVEANHHENWPRISTWKPRRCLSWLALEKQKMRDIGKDKDAFKRTPVDNLTAHPRPKKKNLLCIYAYRHQSNELSRLP